MPVVLRLLIILPVFITVGILALAAHEAGHVVGARLGGFTLRLFSAGPVKLVRDDAGVWHLRRVTTLGEAGGLVLATPTRLEGLRRAAMLLAAGGPAASLLLGAVALVLYARLGLGSYTWTANGALMALPAAVSAFGVVSLGLAAVTGVPYVAAGFSSDGRRVLMLARGGQVAERHAAVMAMSGWFATQPPVTWDAGTIQRALTAGDDGSLDAVMARYLAYLHALGIADPDSAGTHIGVLGKAVEDAPASLRPVIHAELAYFTAAYRGDAREARTYLDRAGQSAVLDAHTRRRAEIAVLLAGENTSEGRARLDALLTELAASRTTLGSSFIVAELHRLAHRYGVSVAPAGPLSPATS